jgi:hypothetical protein
MGTHMPSRAWKRGIYAALAGNLLVALTKFVAAGRVRPAHRPSTATPLSPLLLPRHRCCSRNAVSCVTYDSIHRLFSSSISCAEVVLVLMSNMTTDEATFGGRVPLFDHLRGPFLERFEDRRVATRITCKP